MGSMFGIRNVKKTPLKTFFNTFPTRFLLLSRITHLSDFVLCLLHMNKSNLNLNEFFSSKFFHDQRWTIAEPSLATDARHGIAMTIVELHWSLSTGMLIIKEAPYVATYMVTKCSLRIKYKNVRNDKKPKKDNS